MRLVAPMQSKARRDCQGDPARELRSDSRAGFATARVAARRNDGVPAALPTRGLSGVPGSGALGEVAPP